MPIASIAVPFFSREGIWGRLRFGGARDPAKSTVLRAFQPCIMLAVRRSPFAHDERNIKTSNRELASGIVSRYYARERTGHYVPGASHPRKLTAAIMPVDVPRTCEFTEDG
jgi:hypothetical protein